MALQNLIEARHDPAVYASLSGDKGVSTKAFDDRHPGQDSLGPSAFLDKPPGKVFIGSRGFCFAFKPALQIAGTTPGEHLESIDQA